MVQQFSGRRFQEFQSTEKEGATLDTNFWSHLKSKQRVKFLKKNCQLSFQNEFPIFKE